MFRLIKAVLTLHWLLTLALMGLFALAFGLSSLNIFEVIQANFGVISEHGLMALMDGAALQLVEIIVSGYIAVISYVLLKACEYALVGQIMR
jgi:hypothetical protein